MPLYVGQGNDAASPPLIVDGPDIPDIMGTNTTTKGAPVKLLSSLEVLDIESEQATNGMSLLAHLDGQRTPHTFPVIVSVRGGAFHLRRGDQPRTRA